MTNGPDFSVLAQAFPDAKSIVCFIHPQATYDAVAAATSLCLAIRESGKSCEVVCEEPMRVEYNYLVGIDKVQQSVGNRDLVISFEYNEEQVDKVSYNLDEQNQRFELIIAPKSGGQPLDPSTINFARAGLSADMIFLFGYHSLAELGEIYKKEKYTIDRAYSVAFTQNKIQGFAKLHLALRPENYSYSEMVYYLVRQLQMTEVKQDLATNILSGIEYATERFMQSNLPPRVFETVASLLHQGGQRQPENPAFAHLNTPIRDVESANPPAQGTGNFGQPLPGGLPAGGMAQMPSYQGQVQSGQGQFGQGMPAGQTVTVGQPQVQIAAPGNPSGQPTTTADFARAMQSGGQQK